MSTECSVDQPFLAGITVLDQTQNLPGGYASLLLAEFGARVIKLESPHGDGARGRGPAMYGSGVRHWMINRGKESIALDLKREGSAEVFLRLVDRSDIVLQSFRPATARRLQVDCGAIRDRNPRAICCAITGYGLTGPYAERPGHDINYIAMSGMLALGGSPRKLALPGLPPADMTSGLLAVTAVLLALTLRQSSNTGMTLDISMTDAMLPWLLTVGEALNGSPGQDAGGSSVTGANPAYSTYLTADAEHISLGIREPHFWRNFRQVVNDPRLPDDVPADHDDVTREVLEDLFETRTRAQWEADLADVDTCFSPVLRPQEAPDHVQAQARGSFGEVALPDGRTVTTIAAPCIIDGNRPSFARRRAPFLGENGPALLEELGFSEEERDELVAERVVLFDPQQPDAALQPSR